MKEKLPEIGVRRYGAEATRHAHAHHQLVLPVRAALEMAIDGRGGVVAGLRAAAIPGGVPQECREGCAKASSGAAPGSSGQDRTADPCKEVGRRISRETDP